MLTRRHAGWAGPSLPAGLLLGAAAIGFGASRDFGAFLLSLVILPSTALVVIALVAVDAGARRRSAAGSGVAMLVGAVPLYLCAAALHDQVRFAGWLLTHPEAIRRPGASRLVGVWDGWGIAGMENDSYLAVDRQRGLGTAAGDHRWLRTVRQTCPIVDTRRLWWRDFYLVTTYNCSFDVGRA